MGSLAYKIACHEVSKCSIGAVAKKIGYARSSLNLYLLGAYTANVDAIENKIIATYTDKILCPYANKIIEKKECDDVQFKNLSTSNPVIFRLQQFCRTCPIKHNLKENFRNQFKGEK